MNIGAANAGNGKTDDGGSGGVADDGGEAQRLDLWLWYARFFRSRTTASRLCASGKLRLNHKVVRKAHQSARQGDVLTFPQAREFLVVRIVGLAGRRGPASEARALYEDLAPPEVKHTVAAARAAKAPVARREPGAGRPTKSERRAIDRLKRED